MFWRFISSSCRCYRILSEIETLEEFLPAEFNRFRILFVLLIKGFYVRSMGVVKIREVIHAYKIFLKKCMSSKNSYLHCTDKAVIHKTVIFTKKSENNQLVIYNLDTLIIIEM